MEWFRRAAEQGQHDAMSAIFGRSHLPYPERQKYLHKAIESGSMVANLCLGASSVFGIEMKQDIPSGLLHLHRAGSAIADTRGFSSFSGEHFPIKPPPMTELRALGSGKSGKATLVWLVDGRMAVSKVYHRSELFLKAGLYELVALLGSHSHPNVVKLLGVVNRNIYDGDLEFLLELAEFGSLSNVFHKNSARAALLKEPTVLLSVAADIISGLNQLHSRKLLHRDLTLRNVFVTNQGRAVIGDLGLTRFIDSDYPLEGHDSASTPWVPQIEVCTCSILAAMNVAVRLQSARLVASLLHMISGAWEFASWRLSIVGTSKT